MARETLKWWATTFNDELADPSSLNLRFIPAVKAFNAGQHVYLGTLHHYYVSLINDEKNSPIAGKGRVHGHPGDGKTIGYTMLYILSSNGTSREGGPWWRRAHGDQATLAQAVHNVAVHAPERYRSGHVVAKQVM